MFHLCEKGISRGTWLAQSIEHATRDLRVMSSSPMLGVELTEKEGGLQLFLCAEDISGRAETIALVASKDRESA